MGIGISIFFLALGAVLAFAVNADAEGFNVNTVGYILMAVGALGLLLTTLIFGNRGTTEHTTTVDHHH